MGMKKKDLEKFRKILEEERKRITRHLEELSDSAEQELSVTSASGDPLDVASIEMNQANIQKIGKREEYLLKKIDLAMGKVDDGTYGECENCGEEIGAARLMARPVAQLCIDCKTDQENEERKYSSKSEEDNDLDDAGSEEEEAE